MGIATRTLPIAIRVIPIPDDKEIFSDKIITAKIVVMTIESLSITVTPITLPCDKA